LDTTIFPVFVGTSLRLDFGAMMVINGRLRVKFLPLDATIHLPVNLEVIFHYYFIRTAPNLVVT